MKYFQIHNLCRLCLRLMASFFMVSPLFYCAKGMEAKEQLDLVLLPTATQKFKNYCDDAVKRNISDAELRKGLIKFAEEGENSAIHTLWYNCKSKSLQEQEAVLRKFASAKNSYACNLLATFLANQKNPECLVWYPIVELNPAGMDQDFRGNYAAAILTLKWPLTVKDLQDAWKLLKKWKEIDKVASDHFLKNLYLTLTKAAIKMKAKEFICELYTWVTIEKDNAIRTGIFEPLEGSEYVDIVIERTKLVPITVNMDSTFAREMPRISQLTEKYLERNRNNRQAVKDIVCGNLAALLQEAVVRDIPLMQQYSRYFVGFKGQEPTEKHLICWARLIISNHRDKLLAIPDRDLAVHDMATKVKNIELQDYVVAGFKEIYGYEAPPAAP